MADSSPHASPIHRYVPPPLYCLFLTARAAPTFPCAVRSHFGPSPVPDSPQSSDVKTPLSPSKHLLFLYDAELNVVKPLTATLPAQLLPLVPLRGMTVFSAQLHSDGACYLECGNADQDHAVFRCATDKSSIEKRHVDGGAKTASSAVGLFGAVVTGIAISGPDPGTSSSWFSDHPYRVGMRMKTTLGDGDCEISNEYVVWNVLLDAPVSVGSKRKVNPSPPGAPKAKRNPPSSQRPSQEAKDALRASFIEALRQIDTAAAATPSKPPSASAPCKPTPPKRAGFRARGSTRSRARR